MTSIIPIQTQHVNQTSNEKNSVKKLEDKQSNETQGDDLNISKISQKLNVNSKPSNNKITHENVKDFVPDLSSAMINAQSGGITEEFVANLLNKNPYQN